MGQTLSSPATTKTSESGGDSKFSYSISEMQGWRITMEDAHATVLDLDGQAPSNAFFAVYDGHGGGTVAKFAGQNVHKRLLTEEAYKEKNYETALKKAFLGTDEDLLANPAHTRDPSGCTAVAALITADNKVYVANAGDSRAVIGIKGEVKPLSYDHKPSSETEKARITAAGGYIEYGRVNGNLALSRAIGDFEFKKNYQVSPEAQVITADPDIIVHDITEEDEFMIIACDGIWDCLSNQQAIDFVRYQISEGKQLHEIGEAMCDHCLAPDTSTGAGIGCDNMTVLIVAILHGRTKEEWHAWVTERVKTEYGYKTPSALPQLYAQSRINSFKARKEAMDARDRQWNEKDDSSSSFLSNAGLGGFARVLGSTGGISFHPGSGILSDGAHQLMFADDEDSDEDSGAEDSKYSNATSSFGSSSFFADTIGSGRADGEGDSSDSTQSLKHKLEEFEQGLKKEAEGGIDADGDAKMVEAEPTTKKEEPVSSVSKPNGTEAPPAPSTDLPNGSGSVEQLKSTPGGDSAHPAVKAEGLLDGTEDPLVKSTS